MTFELTYATPSDDSPWPAGTAEHDLSSTVNRLTGLAVYLNRMAIGESVTIKRTT